jgi:hypothetical protein
VLATKKQNIIQLCNLLSNSSHIFYMHGCIADQPELPFSLFSLASLPHLILNDIHQLTRVSRGTLVLISKSGETASLVEMARNALRKGLK